MKWHWDKDDELAVASRACIKALEVMHASLVACPMIERLQKLSLPPVDKQGRAYEHPASVCQSLSWGNKSRFTQKHWLPWRDSNGS